MDNWMEKLEIRRDNQHELILKSRLENMLKEFETKANLSIGQKVRILESIIKMYHDLEIEMCEFDRDDYKNKKKELDMLRRIIENKEHFDEEDSKSWNEYKDEEIRSDFDYIDEEDIDEER